MIAGGWIFERVEFNKDEDMFDYSVTVSSI